MGLILLYEHGHIDAADGRVFEYAHYIISLAVIAQSVMMFDHSLGTMGKRAPFHSHMTKRKQVKTPDMSGARTTAEFQGNVTPPLKRRQIMKRKFRLGAI